MGIKDLIITPIFLILFMMMAYVIRPYVTNSSTRKYFLPAFFLKLFGAIALGLIYQFYYGGGDTFNYFEHGSAWIYKAFWEKPELAIKLLFSEGGLRDVESFQYSQHIWYYRDPNSYFIVRITAFFDLFTFHTYSATALFFALFSFSGLWAFFYAVQKKYPEATQWLAISILFVPTVIFWGSGILKDTITLGALAWLTYAFINIIELKRRSIKYWIIVLFSVWLIYSIKIYILICFFPMVFVWLYWKNIQSVKNPLLKIFIAPALFLIFGFIAFASLQVINLQEQKYSLDAIAERAAITAYDIRYGWGARSGGDGGYDLGVLDGSWQSMVRLLPAAINVSLFRPYLWEVKNPLMLISALESFSLLILSIWFLIYKKQLVNVFKDPFLVFCFFFALLFAFGVGVSTYNFGTLMRYKIPMMPFFLLTLTVAAKLKRK